MAESYNGYCVKCKEKRDFDGEIKVSDSGRRMAQGLCPVCGGDRNLGECPGDHPSTDPRWAGLEQLLQQMDQN